MRIVNGLVLSVLILVVVTSDAPAAQQTVNAPIKQVTVYANMARVVRTTVVSIPAGDHTVLLENLPTNSDPNSYRVEIPGESGVTMINFRQEAKDSVIKITRDVSNARRQRDSLIRLRDRVNDHKAVFQAQKELLTAYQQFARESIGRQVADGALNTAQWEAAYRFVGERMVEVGDSLRRSELAIAQIASQVNECDNQISSAYHETHQKGRSVYIDLQARSVSKCTVLVTYFIPGASWTPCYDARLSPDGRLVNLIAYARIAQSTGENWDSVELSLSTSSPSDNVGPGEYRPISLSVVAPPQHADATITVRGTKDIIDKFAATNQISISQESTKNRPVQTVDDLLQQSSGVQTTSSGEVFIRGSRAGEVAYTVDGAPIGDPLGGTGQAGANLELVSDGLMVPVTFNAKRNETIRSGAEPVRTIIGEWYLATKTKILARPSALEGAYRIATVTNQETVPLLAGPVALFTGSEYIGKSMFVRLIPQNAEFELPFGRENRVSVERDHSSVTRDRDKEETKIDQSVRFVLKNHSDFISTIQLEEPLPVSRDSRIKVRLDTDNIPKPEVDYQGKAIWTITLAPGQTDSLAVPIHVSFPSSVRISGL